MMGLPLWVKYQQRAYLFYIITPPCTRDSSFEVLLEGENCKIGLDATEAWVEKNDSGPAFYDAELIRLIGKAVIGYFHIRKPHYH